MSNRSRVILPQRLFDESKNEDELYAAVKHYLRHYPGYEILEIKRHYAICEIEVI